MGNDGKKIRNPFAELLQDEKLPSELKKRIMSDIAAIKCFIDMADLFAVKQPNVIIDVLFNDSDDNEQEHLSDKKDNKEDKE